MALSMFFQRHQRQADQRASMKAGKLFDVIVKGSTAYFDGKSPVECPYVLDSRDWRAWMIGWEQAYTRGGSASTRPRQRNRTDEKG